MHEVVAALIIKSESILLGQRSPNREFYPGVWDFFGGHIQPGEQQHDTLIRELQEELDITPTKWRFLETLCLSIPDQKSGQTEQLLIHLYRVDAWTGSPVNKQKHEHTSIQWFSLAQALELDLALPIYPEILEEHLSSTPN